MTPKRIPRTPQVAKCDPKRCPKAMNISWNRCSILIKDTNRATNSTRPGGLREALSMNSMVPRSHMGRLLCPKTSLTVVESASRSPPGLVELVALLESFIRMEHLFEVMFMALGYLLGSHLATWGILGTLFEVIFAPSGRIFGVQKWDGAPKVPQEAPPPKFPHPFGHLFGSPNPQKSFPEAPQNEF